MEVVVIAPHAGYAAAVRTALPDARIAVDHFHLIMLANKAVTAVPPRAPPPPPPPRPQARPRGGERAAAAARPRAALTGRVGADVERLRRQRPDRAAPLGMDR